MAPASASHPHRQPSYEYLDALLTALPNDTIPPEITASPSQGNAGAHPPYSQFIDTALRLVSGGPARPDDAPQIRDTWLEIQTSLQRTLHALHPSSSSQQPAKRKHSRSSSSLPTTINNNNNKKPKYEDGGEDDDKDDDDDDDVPQLTLHAISATAPVRHKVDITLHARTLRLAHSNTGIPTASRCARTALTRVFLLPTRARSSGALQWTALLLAGDKPAPPAPRGGKEAKAKAKATAAAAAATAVRFELVCSVPDSSNPAAIPRMTVHAPTSSSTPTSTSQVTSAREAISTLLSSTISGTPFLTPVALTTVERGAPLAGITAFRGVRETSLWFFDDDGANAGCAAGILADARPAEFWALGDLARGEAGVRVRTATGRTCSVVFMRRKSGDDGEEDEEEEEEEGEETEFQMIDGKERERILEWVRTHRGAFGIPKKIQDEDEEEAQVPPRDATNGKDGEDSDSDSNFEVSGESDGGSPSSSGSEAGEDGPRSEGGSGSGSGSENESGGEDEDEGDDDEEDNMDLDDPDPDPDPKHHPLLRAGALPKMSRAAMDAAVELVVGDLVGQGKAPRDAPPAAGPGLGRTADAGASDDDEEDDELED
jgi:hypothetical protein